MPFSNTPLRNPGEPAPLPGRGYASPLDKELDALKQRLVREATSAVAMLEAALDALWRLDRDAATETRRRDDRIDSEEVAIEEEALRIMVLRQPVASDFRILAFVLKANADIERVADHATSIAKTVLKFPEGAVGTGGAGGGARWPAPLTELGERVPVVCHSLLRILLDEDAEAARAIVTGDEAIDALNRRLFDETLDLMQPTRASQAAGLLIYRIGRELERIGDLMANMAEDIVYLRTGQIIRHQKKLAKGGL